MWNGRFFVLSRLISWTSYSMCDNADKRKKTNIVPNSNSLFVGFFQLKYMFWRQRIKVLSLALLTLRLSIFYNPRYINDPAKSKTDSWANVYRDDCFKTKKTVFSFSYLKRMFYWIYKECVILTIQEKRSYLSMFILGNLSSVNISFSPWDPLLMDPQKFPGGPINGATTFL